MNTIADPTTNGVQNSEQPQEDETQGALADVTLEQLPQRLQDAVTRAGWTTLTPVHSRAIPYLLAERDVRCFAIGAQAVRFVTHLDVSADQISEACEIIKTLAGSPLVKSV